MTTTGYKYSPSVNIVSDRRLLLKYIPTPNARQVFTQLVNDYMLGTHSFSLIGAYGSGKSSFLWALEKNINRKREDFAELNGQFNEVESFEYLPVIGEYKSIIQTIKKIVCKDIDRKCEPEDVINQLDRYYNSVKKSNRGLLFVIDEFGKFLEYISKNNPEKELYFIQQLAEYVNDAEKDILLITTLHQDFSAYALGLTKSQRLEWDKVKGRLKEITFNEPVEQLLYLASERLNSQTKYKKTKDYSKLFNAIKEAKVFPLRDYFREDFAERLLPFDILSASVLTLALQRYGQNERSLFSFIESSDYLGLNDFNVNINPYFNLGCVYDYLIHNYYSFLSTKYNPNYSQWSSIRTSIERVEGVLDEHVDDALKLVKSIGLLNIFANAPGKIDMDFLSNYGRFSLGIKSPEKIISTLESHKIIRFVKHNSKFILFEGTDLDIELEIEKAVNFIDHTTNIVNSLSEYFDFPYIPAKAIQYEKGTPRYFSFKLSEEPINIKPEGEIDGFINLIFSTKLEEEDVKKASKKCREAILHGWYRNTDLISKLIFEIQKVKQVCENNLQDKVALRELDSILDHEIKLLNNEVVESLYSKNSPISWYFGGKKLNIEDRKTLNGWLSHICDKVYNSTPVFKNEMVNRTNLSSAILTARRNLLRALVNNWKENNLGFSEKEFPPEKTIYLSLLYHTGIHRSPNLSEDDKDLRNILCEPIEESFNILWKAGIEFLNGARENNRNLQELVYIYTDKPFKLKKGFIDFWLPIFLFVNREIYALFHESTYVPHLNEDVLDLIIKNPRDFEIKAFDVQGRQLDLFNEYRNIIQKSQEEKLTNASFIETIKPFLTFYKSLPNYTKNTKRLSKNSISLRNAIANSKSPEKLFFEEFPGALGYNLKKLLDNSEELEKYVSELMDSIKEIRICYDHLVNRVEDYLKNEILSEDLAFSDYKFKLQKRYAKIKINMLLAHQKLFHQRLLSELDQRESWLNSIAYACIGKSLDEFYDEDEYRLYEKLKEIVYELDNLCEISKSDIEWDKEDVYKIEITSFIKGLQKNLIRLPKLKSDEIVKLENKIKESLGEDKKANIIALTRLLQEQFKNE